MDNVMEILKQAVEVELKEANQKNRPFASLHEGYAVMLEEFEEAMEELEAVSQKTGGLWAAVRGRPGAPLARDVAMELLEHSMNALAELCQYAAMCRKMLDFCGVAPPPEVMDEGADLPRVPLPLGDVIYFADRIECGICPKLEGCEAFEAGQGIKRPCPANTRSVFEPHGEEGDESRDVRAVGWDCEDCSMEIKEVEVERLEYHLDDEGELLVVNDEYEFTVEDYGEIYWERESAEQALFAVKGAS